MLILISEVGDDDHDDERLIIIRMIMQPLTLITFHWNTNTVTGRRRDGIHDHPTIPANQISVSLSLVEVGQL